MIVRARAKVLQEIPPRYLCCEQAKTNAHYDAGEEVFIETTLTSIRDDQCCFCGALIEQVAGAQIVGEPIGNEIALECWELDEGETRPADFLNA